MALGYAIGGAVAGGVGAYMNDRMATKMRRRGRAAIDASRAYAEGEAKRVAGMQGFQDARRFLEGIYSDDANNNPLVRDVGMQIRAAQAARGTFNGNVGAAAEGLGAGAFLQNLRLSAYDTLEKNLTFEPRFTGEVMSWDAPFRVAAATGAALPGMGQGNMSSQFASLLGGAVSGFGAGYNVGSSMEDLALQREGIANQRMLMDRLTAAPAAQKSPLMIPGAGGGQDMGGFFNRLLEMGADPNQILGILARNTA